MSATQRPRVVIVGGGFGGLAAARELAGADVDVTLVDRRNHLVFQPLLYQAAAGLISADDCASAIRVQLSGHANMTVLMGEVVGFDVERRQVLLDQDQRLDYDKLIVACGGESSYFGHDEWAQNTYGLKTLVDAVELRERIFSAFEEAERTSDGATREAWLTFVVVGGGPTGVEIAGQIAILGRTAMKNDFRHFDPRTVRVILADAGDRVLASFSERLSRKAARYLGEVGVTVREGVRVTDVDDTSVTVQTPDGNERIVARTVVWAAGVSAAGAAVALAQATGVSADHGGRVGVNPDLTVPGHPEIVVVGDAASLAGADGQPLPGLATVAIQQARHAARAIKHGSAAAGTPFHYFDKGALAVIGQRKAICAVRGLELAGPAAFATYLGVHLYYLGGGIGKRAEVLLAWGGTLRGRREGRLIEGTLPIASGQRRRHLREDLERTS